MGLQLHRCGAAYCALPLFVDYTLFHVFCIRVFSRCGRTKPSACFTSHFDQCSEHASTQCYDRRTEKPRFHLISCFDICFDVDASRWIQSNVRTGSDLISMKIGRIITNIGSTYEFINVSYFSIAMYLNWSMRCIFCSEKDFMNYSIGKVEFQLDLCNAMIWYFWCASGLYFSMINLIEFFMSALWMHDIKKLKLLTLLLWKCSLDENTLCRMVGNVDWLTEKRLKYPLVKIFPFDVIQSRFAFRYVDFWLCEFD